VTGTVGASRVGRFGRRSLAWVLGALAGCAAPDGTAGDGEAGGPKARAAGAVLTVDGQPVAPADLQWARDAIDDGPIGDWKRPELAGGDRALEALLRRELLVAEARRRGLGDARSPDRAATQAMVQQLLAREIEAPESAREIPDEVVRGRYQQAGERFRASEKRASRHILARFPEGRDAPTPEEIDALRPKVTGIMADVLAAVRRDGGIPEDRPPPTATLPGGMSWVVEDVPAFGPEGALDPAYREALFSIDGTGVVPRVVESGFGFHVLEVVDIVPPKVVPYEAAEAELREELLVERRRGRLEAFLHELRRGTDVEVLDAGLETFLSVPADRLGARAPGGAER